MTLFKKRFRIESSRHPNWSYGNPGWYFVTICTHEKICSFGTVRRGEVFLSPAGRTAYQQMANLQVRYSNVRLDSFVIMPNHVHAIVVIKGIHRYSPALSSDPSVSKDSTGFAQDGASPVSTLSRVNTQLSMPSQPTANAETRRAAPRSAMSRLQAKSLADVVGGYKAGVARICHANGFTNFAWQSRFYDRILSSDTMVHAVRDYIDGNPTNWAKDPDRLGASSRR